MEVFHDQEHGLLGGQLQDQSEGRLERALSMPLRAQRQRRIAALGKRYGQQRGQEIHRIGLGQTDLPQLLLQVRDPYLHGLAPIDLERALEQLCHRMERTMLVVGRATSVQQQMRLARGEHLERVHQAGLADSRLAADHHNLAEPLLDLGPALQEQAGFPLPAHQGS